MFAKAIKQSAADRVDDPAANAGFRLVAAEMKGDRALVNPASAWDL
jgi:hypothetical protein